MDSTNTAAVSDERPLVLVIDDEIGPRESLRFLLKEDYRVLCASSVETGIDIVRGQSPDAVIMDIRMPGRNGIDGLRDIRSIDADLAVIMLTGFAAVGTAQAAIRYEASDYMEKPFDATEMANVVHRHVEQTRLRRKRAALLKEADELSQRIRDLQTKEHWVELGQSSAEFVHDLRNVLAIVSTSSSVLRCELEELQQRHTPSSEAGYFLDTLENAMQRCIDMLDTWQRLIRQAPEQLTTFSIADLVRACVDTHTPAAQKAGASLTCDVQGESSGWLGDRIQLGRVLDNLVQNALHALPETNGAIHIHAEQSAEALRIDIRDNGCGIPGENQNLIFSPNFTTRRKHGGMGLGLFIAQKIVQIYGGTISVQSAVGKGSTFALRLPVLSGTKPVTHAD